MHFDILLSILCLHWSTVSNKKRKNGSYVYFCLWCNVIMNDHLPSIALTNLLSESSGRFQIIQLSKCLVLISNSTAVECPSGRERECLFKCISVYTHAKFNASCVIFACVCLFKCISVYTHAKFNVCVCGLVRTYIRGQFCVFNHLTGDVRQVGTSPVHITMQSTFGHVWYIQCIF